MNELAGVSLLWNLDYDDGPITGICKHDNRLRFFYLDEDASHPLRTYNVIPLTIKQSAYEMARRLAFHVMVVKCPLIAPALWYSKMFKCKSDYYISLRLDPLGFFRR